MIPWLCPSSRSQGYFIGIVFKMRRLNEMSFQAGRVFCAPCLKKGRLLWRKRLKVLALDCDSVLLLKLGLGLLLGNADV